MQVARGAGGGGRNVPFPCINLGTNQADASSFQISKFHRQETVHLYNRPTCRDRLQLYTQLLYTLVRVGLSKVQLKMLLFAFCTFSYNSVKVPFGSVVA